MARQDVIERARRAGARRRALDEGRPLPPEPIEPHTPEPLSGDADAQTSASVTPAVSPSTTQDPGADGTSVPGGSAPTGTGTDPAAVTTPAPAVAGGPWFDARAFFLGWLAMIAAVVAGLPAVVIAAAGFAAAYLLARRGRLANAIASVGGAFVATFVALAALLVIGLIASA